MSFILVLPIQLYGSSNMETVISNGGILLDYERLNDEHLDMPSFTEIASQAKNHPYLSQERQPIPCLIRATFDISIWSILFTKSIKD
jgi:hypothetical protein